MPSACAFFTKGSEKCSLSQRWLDLLRVATTAGRIGETGRHDTLPPVSALSCRMPIALSNAQIRFLRGQAHDLKAMLQVGGKGITDALAAEVDGALEHHELIKVKVSAEDRDARDAMIAALAERSDAVLVQRI